MQLEDVLKIADVHLALGSSTRTLAVEEVLAQLNGDERVTDWEMLRQAVIGHDAAMLESGACGICIAHGRTQALKTLVLAAGRSEQGLPDPEGGPTTQLIFVAGIPAAMNAQYLTLVGAIARACSNKRSLDRLLNAKSPTDFVAALQTACVSLE